jgi:hypothetical protein
MIKYKIPVLKKYYTLQKRVKGNFHADWWPINNISKSVNSKMKYFTEITKVTS